MTTCPNSPTHNIQAKRRNLRSNSKPMTNNINSNSTNLTDNVHNQIKFEIEHQQANNATKTSFPVESDIRPFQSIVSALEFPLVSIHTDLQQVCQFESFSNDIAAQNSLSNVLLASEISPQEKLQSFDGLQKKETYLETPTTKASSKIFKWTESSPYESKRRSYRKIIKQNTKCVPFRKCQDQLEIRIVGLINKISRNKHTAKEVEILCDKLAKISLRDLYNPYVISGVQTICKLLEKKSLQQHVKSIFRLQNQVKSLSERIWSELGSVDDYEDFIQVKKSINLQVTRQKVVRKVYKMLIQQRNCEPVLARVKSFEVCDSFFTQCNNQTSQEDLIDFLKQQNFLSP